MKISLLPFIARFRPTPYVIRPLLCQVSRVKMWPLNQGSDLFNGPKMTGSSGCWFHAVTAAQNWLLGKNSICEEWVTDGWAETMLRTGSLASFDWLETIHPLIENELCLKVDNFLCYQQLTHWLQKCKDLLSSRLQFGCKYCRSFQHFPTLIWREFV